MFSVDARRAQGPGFATVQCFHEYDVLRSVLCWEPAARNRENDERDAAEEHKTDDSGYN